MPARKSKKKQLYAMYSCEKCRRLDCDDVVACDLCSGSISLVLVFPRMLKTALNNIHWALITDRTLLRNGTKTPEYHIPFKKKNICLHFLTVQSFMNLYGVSIIPYVADC